MAKKYYPIYDSYRINEDYVALVCDRKIIKVSDSDIVPYFVDSASKADKEEFGVELMAKSVTGPVAEVMEGACVGGVYVEVKIYGKADDIHGVINNLKPCPQKENSV